MLTRLNELPANTRRCFDVDSTSFERYGRQMDVETTLCAYWVAIKECYQIENRDGFHSWG